ncbi:MAG: hypothetical protein EP344_12200 [Bacteroidetes bacterium]|nr:MAG: hypothetical protein EP344_12200 [Bacteroidota bacterium]
MNLLELSEQVRSLIGFAQTDEALALLSLHCSGLFPQFKDDVVLLEGRLSNAKRYLRQGQLSPEEFRRILNEINFSIVDLLEDAVKQLPVRSKRREGKLLHSIPGEMTVGEVSLCVIRIAYDEVQLRKDLPKDLPDTMVQNLEVSELMGVELIDDNDEPAFTIQRKTKPHQPTAEDHYSEWLFDVTPLRSGRFPLRVKISMVKKIGEDEYLENISLEKDIVITSKPVEKAVEPVQLEYSNIAFYYTVTPAKERDKAAAAPVPPSPVKENGGGEPWFESHRQPVFEMPRDLGDFETGDVRPSSGKRTTATVIKVLLGAVAVALCAFGGYKLYQYLSNRNADIDGGDPFSIEPPPPATGIYAFPLQGRDLAHVELNGHPADFHMQNDSCLVFFEPASNNQTIRVHFADDRQCFVVFLATRAGYLTKPFSHCTEPPGEDNTDMQPTEPPRVSEPPPLTTTPPPGTVSPGAARKTYRLTLVQDIEADENVMPARPIFPRAANVWVGTMPARLSVPPRMKNQVAQVRLEPGAEHQVRIRMTDGSTCEQEMFLGDITDLTVKLCPVRPVLYTFKCSTDYARIVQSITIDGHKPDRLNTEGDQITISKRLLPAERFTLFVTFQKANNYTNDKACEIVVPADAKTFEFCPVKPINRID